MPIEKAARVRQREVARVQVFEVHVLQFVEGVPHQPDLAGLPRPGDHVDRKTVRQPMQCCGGVAGQHSVQIQRTALNLYNPAPQPRETLLVRGRDPEAEMAHGCLRACPVVARLVGAKPWQRLRFVQCAEPLHFGRETQSIARRAVGAISP